MTVDEFLTRHTARQLTEIIARDRIDPYDLAGRIELGLAKIAALLVNRWRDPNQSEAVSVADMLPQWGREFRESAERERIEQQLNTETPEQATQRIKAGFAALRAARRGK